MRALAAIVVCAIGLAVVPATAGAYGWPVKPFGVEHPIRSGFDDPRYHVDEGVRDASFHFGVDVAVPDGTPVYAVAPGRAVSAPGHVSVRTGTREFGYWHVVPAVMTGQRIRLHQLVGYVAAGWGHLHFAEGSAGVYVNPLRRGGLTPYRDTTTPIVASVAAVTTDGAPLGTRTVHGTIGLVAEAYDLPPLAPPPPWQGARLAPALVRWRLVRGGVELYGWHASPDLGIALLPNGLYDLVYAPGTYQNKPNRPGRYIYWLDRELDTSKLEPGAYDVEVEAQDLAGHTGTATLTLTVGG